mgnify:CR=1 FL=1
MGSVYIIMKQAKYSNYPYPVVVYSKLEDAESYIAKRRLEDNNYCYMEVQIDQDDEKPFIRLLISRSGYTGSVPFATGIGIPGTFQDQFYYGDLLVTAWTADYQEAVDIAKATRLLALANGYTDWSRNVAI